MSEKSLEVFIGDILEPPEMDADEEQLEENFQKAFYESSKIDIIDSIKTSVFKETWLVLKRDIQFETIKLQRIFSEQTLDKISEVYDYQFPITIDLDTQAEINQFYSFLEFLEYDNTNFISNVWKFLGPSDLIHLDIDKFCKSNDNKIIKEIDEQIDIHHQSRLITLFLRTYYKSKMIDWFTLNSEQRKVDITVKLNTKEG